ncbi:hypothetical protein RRG08_017991 [Elysia crispata]|uniref:Uncharacterized protein n=1 Tax=Elysia crispata TaxID=231223 RepID=A0AAE0ZD72_9GAST|nr:hypothetical protein RRG08_017991 [Elysia crispata]
MQGLNANQAGLFDTNGLALLLLLAPSYLSFHMKQILTSAIRNRARRTRWQQDTSPDLLRWLELDLSLAESRATVTEDLIPFLLSGSPHEQVSAQLRPSEIRAASQGLRNYRLVPSRERRL